jgi:hypothetical protein
MAPSSAAAAYVSPDDADLNWYEQEEIAFGNFKVGESDKTPRLFSGGAAFHTAPVTTHSNTPFATVRMRLGLQPLQIGSHHAPIIETVHSNDVEELDTVAQPPIPPHPDDAESMTALPATMERPSQREHRG